MTTLCAQIFELAGINNNNAQVLCEMLEKTVNMLQAGVRFVPN